MSRRESRFGLNEEVEIILARGGDVSGG